MPKRRKYCPEERFQYLKELISEFNNTQSSDAKHQVLANLCNFAYDPINYLHLRKLKFIPILLDQISSSDPKLVQFAVKGLCNLSPDKDNAKIILSLGGKKLIEECLFSEFEEVLSAALSTLFILEENIDSNEIKDRLKRLCSYPDKRVSNVAHIMLQRSDLI